MVTQAGTRRRSSDYVTVDGLRLRVRRSGQGPPLLLINGVGAALEMWQPLVPELEGFEVITFDMPGCGMSATLPRPLRMQGLTDIVDGLMLALDRPHAHVLGYSHGGLVAQELAYRHPERIDRLVLCSTTPGTPSMPPNPKVAWAMMTPARYYDRRSAMAMVPLIAGGRTRREPAVLRKQIALRLAHPPSVVGYTHQLYATWAWSSHRWLHRLRQDTLVMHGDDDPLVPLANARYVAFTMPAATLRVMPGAGHLMLLDEAPAAGRVIREFLAS